MQQLGEGAAAAAVPSDVLSVFGGVILDPAMMLIPIDDHMVHRGHGVFDTTMIVNGFLYELDEHLDRFLGSASKAKIASPFPRPTLRSILIQLAAVSRCWRGTVRFWLSAGPGNFLLSPAGCPTPAFYAVVTDDELSRSKGGVRVVTSDIPMKSPLFATTKSVNYLPNVLNKMEAEEKGAEVSMWVDEEGYIAEGPYANVACITRDNELIVPPFDKVLRGCTVVRLIELAGQLVEQRRLERVRVGNLTVSEAKGAKEMMLVGSIIVILPVVMWDGNPIGNGEVGEMTTTLSELLWEDMVSGPGRKRTPIPYE